MILNSFVQRNVVDLRRVQVRFQLSVLGGGRLQSLRETGARRRDRRKSVEKIFPVRQSAGRPHSSGSRQSNHRIRTATSRNEVGIAISLSARYRVAVSERKTNAFCVAMVTDVHRRGVRARRFRHGQPAVFSRVRVPVRSSKRVFVRQAVRFGPETARGRARGRAGQSVRDEEREPGRVDRGNGPRGFQTGGRRLVQIRRVRVSVPSPETPRSTRARRTRRSGRCFFRKYRRRPTSVANATGTSRSDGNTY